MLVERQARSQMRADPARIEAIVLPFAPFSEHIVVVKRLVAILALAGATLDLALVHILAMRKASIIEAGIDTVQEAWWCRSPTRRETPPAT